MSNDQNRNRIRVLRTPGVLFIAMLFGLVGALLYNDWREIVALLLIGVFLPFAIRALWGKYR